MARPPLDLGRERDDCPARYHGTYSAADKAGCICSHAIADRRERNRAYERTRGPRSHKVVDIHRWRDADPIAVRHALDGRLPARKLTTDERRRVVAHLARRGMKDHEIAELLRWSGGGQRGRLAVAKFRSRWNIPSARPRILRDREQMAA